MTTGERIKQRRIELGLSVDELAKKLKKNRATIYRYENNDIENFPTSVITPLANALETTPAYLMGWESDPEKGNIKDIQKKFVERIVSDFMQESKKSSNEDTHRARINGIIKYFERLNPMGQLEAIKRVEELTYIDKYVNKKILEDFRNNETDDISLLNAAHSILNSSKEDIQNDEDIMNDENF